MRLCAGSTEYHKAGLACLEQAAEHSRPSINDTLDTLNAQIAQKEAQKTAPARSGQRDER